MSTDSASFVVDLIDRITEPSRVIARSLGGINARLKETGRISSLSGRGLKMLFAQRVGGALDSGVARMTDGIVHYGKYAALALGAAGVAAAAFVIKGVVGMGMFAEASRRAFASLTGSTATGDDAFKRSIDLSKKLGLDVVETTHGMEKMLALQFSTDQAETFIKLSSDLRAVGASADAVQRALLDITHVKAVGFLQGRELRSFASAGVSVQLIMEEVAKGMGISVDKVHEAISKKKVTADIALPAIQRAIMRKTHEHEAGQAGESFASSTLTGLVGKLENIPKLFFLRVSEQAQGAIGKLKPLIDELIDQVDNISAGDVVKFVGQALDIMRAMVPLVVEFGKGFLDGLSSINEIVGSLDPTKASLATARDLGRSLADAFGLMLKALKLIVDAVVFLDNNRWLIKTIGGVILLSKLFGGFAPILMAFASGTTAPLQGVWLLVKAWKGVRDMIRGASAAKAAVDTVSSLASVGAGTAEAASAVTGGAAVAGTAAAVGGSAAAAEAGALAATGAGGAVATSAAAMAGGIALAILPGIAAAGIGYYFREKTANWMLDTFAPRTDQASARGLDAPLATPTLALQNMQQQGRGLPANNTVTVQELHVNVDGGGKDPSSLGIEIAEKSSHAIEQHWQGLALESGAM